MKYFVRSHINNPATVAIRDEYINLSKPDSTDKDTGEDVDEGFDGPFEFTPQDTSDDNAFWPLLGSPNDGGIAHFLIDHKQSMKGKMIKSLSFFHTPEMYVMWATLE
jgi:hypothetical protein